MKSVDVLEGKSLLKLSKAIGTKYTTKLEDDITLYALDKKSNSVYVFNIVKDKRTADKYFVKSEEYDKIKFVADGSVQMVFFGPIILAKIGATVKSKENIYFAVDDNIEIYE